MMIQSNFSQQASAGNVRHPCPAVVWKGHWSRTGWGGGTGTLVGHPEEAGTRGQRHPTQKTEGSRARPSPSTGPALGLRMSRSRGTGSACASLLLLDAATPGTGRTRRGVPRPSTAPGVW